MKSLRKSHLSIAVAAALSTSLTSGIVLAQEGADDEVLTTEEVLVTGSRIATVDGFGATSPVTVVNAEEIANLGFVNIEQVLNSLPSIEASQNANISNGSAGTASIDLRGMDQPNSGSYQWPPHAGRRCSDAGSGRWPDSDSCVGAC